MTDTTSKMKSETTGTAAGARHHQNPSQNLQRPPSDSNHQSQVTINSECIDENDYATIRH
jgi:hypothetical protein